MSRRPPFVAPALVAAAVACAFCVTLLRSPARANAPRILLQYGARPRGDDVVGQKMPPLRFDRWLNTPGNQPLDPAGKVTLYRWWTDGCAHCEKTLPAVEKLRQKYGARGLRVVAVYHPKPPRDVSDRLVLRGAEDFGYQGPVALDLDWSQLRKFYLSTGERPATSASFLVDGDGVIRLAHPGPRFYPSNDPADAQEDADYRRIEAEVEKLLKPAK